jgi:hypothetical protein
LDRRSAGIIGATLSYATRTFFFPSNKMDIVAAIDFDVLALLSGIMVTPILHTLYSSTNVSHRSSIS